MQKSHPEIRVECYSGYRADERPIALYRKERRIPIIEILDRWYDPEADYFKVHAANGGFYLLRHDKEEDRWFVITMELSDV